MKKKIFKIIRVLPFPCLAKPYSCLFILLMP